MPVSGGAADKLGTRYEGLWAIHQCLRILDGTARELTLEPLDPEESRGIEFRVVNTGGTTDYWSVKRQRTRAAGWTLATLARKDDRGRSILGDLLAHVERDPANCGVFASTLGAGDFEELKAHANDSLVFNARLDRSGDLKSDFLEYLLPLCGGDVERARAFLLRARAHAVDEGQLREWVEFGIRKLICGQDGSPADTAAVRGYLSDLLLETIHRPLIQDAILKALAAHGIRRCEWAIDRTVTDRIAAICELNSGPLRAELINSKFLQLAASDAVLSADGRPVSSKVLVTGSAGSGKSSMLAAAVEKLKNVGIPVLPLRFDHLPEGILRGCFKSLISQHVPADTERAQISEQEDGERNG